MAFILVSADVYVDAINPHIHDGHIDGDTANDFFKYLREFPEDTNWYEHWQECRTSMKTHITYCEAIAPIESELSDSCLCQLEDDCDNWCDDKVRDLYFDTTGYMLGSEVDYHYITQHGCNTIMDGVNATYQALCAHSEMYKLVSSCGMTLPLLTLRCLCPLIAPFPMLKLPHVLVASQGSQDSNTTALSSSTASPTNPTSTDVDSTSSPTSSPSADPTIVAISNSDDDTSSPTTQSVVEQTPSPTLSDSDGDGGGDLGTSAPTTAPLWPSFEPTSYPTWNYTLTAPTADINHSRSELDVPGLSQSELNALPQNRNDILSLSLSLSLCV